MSRLGPSPGFLGEPGWRMATGMENDSSERRCGFELRHESGAGEEMYWLWCFKV